MAYNGPRGTGFVSLADYLNLNREGAQRMGDELAGDVSQRGTASQKAIQDYGTTFNGQVAAGTPVYDATGIKTEDEANKAAEGATYKGPQQWDAETAKTLGTQAGDAAQRARMAASEYGRGTLLQQRYAPNGGYSAGAAGLDSFLAGRGMGNRGAEGVSKFGELQSMLTGQQTAGANAAANAAKQAATVKGQYEELARSLHTDPNAHKTLPNTQSPNTPFQPNNYSGTDSQRTPDTKGGGKNETPGTEDALPPGYQYDENGRPVRIRPRTGGTATPRY